MYVCVWLGVGDLNCLSAAIHLCQTRCLLNKNSALTPPQGFGGRDWVVSGRGWGKVCLGLGAAVTQLCH